MHSMDLCKLVTFRGDRGDCMRLSLACFLVFFACAGINDLLCANKLQNDTLVEINTTCLLLDHIALQTHSSSFLEGLRPGLKE